MPKSLRKSLPNDLGDEVYRLLQLYAERKPDGYKEMQMGHPELTEEATRYLQDLGLMDYRMDFGPRLTAQGHEYWEELTTFAPWYWFKKNCFPATVGFATIATSVSGIIFKALE